MNMDRFKKEVYYTIDYREFEKLVNEIYSVVGFNFAEARECGNDSEHEFLAQRKPLDDYEEEEMKKFIDNPKNCGYCTVDNIFDDLCNKKIIEPGNYLISVSW